jgi:integrase
MGHKKNSKGTVSITNAKGRIRLRWRCQKERYSLNLFAYNKANLLKSKKVALVIEQDIIDGCFDTSLNKYHPEIHLLDLQSSTKFGQAKSVASAEEENSQAKYVVLFEQWTHSYRNRDCDKHCHYRATRNMVRKWGEFDYSRSVVLLSEENINAETYNVRLSLLQGFSNWLLKSGHVSNNPFEEVQRKQQKKSVDPKRKPLSTQEITAILQALKNDTYCSKTSSHKHSHYYPFVYFMFRTGVRNAEAIGLQVRHLMFERRLIEISEALARTLQGSHAAARVRKETKNGKKRFLPMTDDLAELLLPLVNDKEHEDLVFLSPTGVAIDDRMFQKRIYKPILKHLGISDRVLYACRHTFQSMCIEMGFTPITTAFMLGNNPETALRHYTHQMTLPKELPNTITDQ